MFKTIRPDWYFVIPATVIWLAAIGVTAWDFSVTRGAVFRLGILNLVGACLLLAGLALRLAARRALARHFSYALRTLDNHRLITHGPYQYVRHPAYTGDLLFQFGVTLLFSSLYGLAIMVLLVPCFIYRATVEENMLIAKFGDEYREYMRNTRRFIPGLY